MFWIHFRCHSSDIENDERYFLKHHGTLYVKLFVARSSVFSFHWVTLEMNHWLCFYQTRSAWSMDQGSNKNHSPINNFTPTVTKFCVMWEGQALPHDTKFGNCRDKIVDSRAFLSWSLIHGSSWSRLIKAEPGLRHHDVCLWYCMVADDACRYTWLFMVLIIVNVVAPTKHTSHPETTVWIEFK